jgi:hypothetical protein
MLAVNQSQCRIYRKEQRQRQNLGKLNPLIPASHGEGKCHALTLQKGSVLVSHRGFWRMVQGPPIGLAAKCLILLGVEDEFMPQQVDPT